MTMTMTTTTMTMVVVVMTMIMTRMNYTDLIRCLSSVAAEADEVDTR